MSGRAIAAEIAARSPALRGRLAADAPLAPFTWFRVGGPAEVLFSPADEDDLAYLLANLPPEVPVTVIGFGSNLIIRDGGIRGVVIRLGGKAFGAVETTRRPPRDRRRGGARRPRRARRRRGGDRRPRLPSRRARLDRRRAAHERGRARRRDARLPGRGARGRPRRRAPPLLERGDGLFLSPQRGARAT